MAIPRKLLGGPQLAAHHSVSPSCHHVVMSSCHHAVKDFCMIHTNKKQGHSSAEDGCPVGYPKKSNLYLFAWEAKRVGDEGRLPPARSLWLVPPPCDQSARLWSWPWPSSINFLAARSWWRMTLSSCCVSCRRLR